MICSELTAQANSATALRISSLQDLAQVLGVPLNHLEYLARHAFSHYKPRFDGEGAKTRLLDRPSDRLKRIQKLIKKRILDRIELPSYVIGGVKGQEPTEHPSAHVHKPVVVTIDVRDCYRSISNRRVFEIWRGRLGCSAQVSRLATMLTTFQGRLPIGAPTSTLLAILRILPAVERIAAIAEARGLTIRLYIDDLAISGDEISDEVVNEIIREFAREGIRINRGKVTRKGSGSSQRITGKVVNRRLAMSVADRNRVRAAVHELTQTDPKNTLYPRRYWSALGRVQNLERFHPREGAKYKDVLAQLPRAAPLPQRRGVGRLVF